MNPVVLDSRGMHGNSVRCSSFDTGNDLFEACRQLSKARNKLAKLGFTGSDHETPPDNPSTRSEVAPLVSDLVFHGEELLLYHKRLAQSAYAYGFLSQQAIIEDDNWNRYPDKRLAKEIHQLVKDTDELLFGYSALQREDEEFLVRSLDLPRDLEPDFRTARNLFSLGFDEVGLFVAGRGLEGVLRKIAKRRKIKIEVKGKIEDAWDADFKDVIEFMYRLRWKADDKRLISARTKALLDYLRTTRNQRAHPDSETDEIGMRESAVLVAMTANELWSKASNTRVRFKETSIIKNW